MNLIPKYINLCTNIYKYIQDMQDIYKIPGGGQAAAARPGPEAQGPWYFVYISYILYIFVYILIYFATFWYIWYYSRFEVRAWTSEPLKRFEPFGHNDCNGWKQLKNTPPPIQAWLGKPAFGNSYIILVKNILSFLIAALPLNSICYWIYWIYCTYWQHTSWKMN